MIIRKLSLVFCLLAGATFAFAQPRPRPHDATRQVNELTPVAGNAIVSSAWDREQQQEEDRKPDCSHLAHEIYTLAGYPYPYANSFDLYRGIASFVRVKTPQAGDLIVWRGHVGIVVGPAEHSFYSSLRSGLLTDFYDAPHWKRRGSARFYRYATAGENSSGTQSAEGSIPELP